MMKKATLPISTTRPICRCELPENFGLYIRSYSNVKDSYRFKDDGNNSGMLPNELISEKDVNKII